MPADLRHAITAESGINDGLALPIVMLPIFLILGEQPSNTGHRMSDWGIKAIAIETGSAVVVGVVAGYLAHLCMRWATRDPNTDRSSLLTIALALALATLTGLQAMGGNGVLGASIAGATLNEAYEKDHAEHQEHFNEAISRLFDLPIMSPNRPGDAISGTAACWKPRWDTRRAGSASSPWPGTATGAQTWPATKPQSSSSVVRWLASFSPPARHTPIAGEVVGWDTAVATADFLQAHWRDRSNGIWEEAYRRRYTSGLVFLACALDRIAEHATTAVQAAGWREAAAAIRDFVSAHCRTSGCVFGARSGSKFVDISAALSRLGLRRG